MSMQRIIGAATRAVEEMAAIVNAGGGGGRGRGLHEGGPEERRPPPGHSEIAYMQHKYTPLDTRIIIITAAILVLLLSILFLNFFIRWALRRFFLLHSQKPINPNKGLSKRQVQSLPSFIYSSSKPPIFYSSHPPTPPCDPPKFYHHLLPITFHGGHNLKPHSCHDLPPTKIGSHEFYHPKCTEFYHDPSPKSTVDEVAHTPPSQLGSTKVDNDPPTKFEFDEVIEGNNPPTKGDEVANDANSIIGSTKSHVLTIDGEVKANLPTFKGGNPIIGCTKIDEMPSHGVDNASSHAPCPICLVDYADGDTIRVLPTCRHYFHIGCIDMWLTKSSSCPACRANILDATKNPIKQPTLQVQVTITTSH